MGGAQKISHHPYKAAPLTWNYCLCARPTGGSELGQAIRTTEPCWLPSRDFGALSGVSSKLGSSVIVHTTEPYCCYSSCSWNGEISVHFILKVTLL